MAGAGIFPIRVLFAKTFLFRSRLMLSRGYRYLLPLIAPTHEGCMEDGVNLHDTHCFWWGEGGLLLSMNMLSWPIMLSCPVLGQHEVSLVEDAIHALTQREKRPQLLCTIFHIQRRNLFAQPRSQACSAGVGGRVKPTGAKEVSLPHSIHQSNVHGDGHYSQQHSLHNRFSMMISCVTVFATFSCLFSSCIFSQLNPDARDTSCDRYLSITE